MKTMIVVHCSDTYTSMDIGAEEIRGWHKALGWDDIGYHIVIRRDGSYEEGRELTAIGAHARGYNHMSIGICLIGGKGTLGKPEANFTLEQYTALKSIVVWLKATHPIATVVGHRDLPNVTKTCPNFNVSKLLGDI